MKSTKITAAVLAKDEALRLPLIIENLKDFAEIVVFDGGSTDATEAICRQHGVRFIRRPPELRSFIGADYEFAFSHVDTPYILIVNCSHYYPQRLLAEFKRVADEGKYHAVYHDVVIYTYARVVHRPFFRRCSSATNCYRVDAVNFENRVVHNEAPVEVPEHLKWKVPASDEYAIHLFRDYDVKKAELNHSFYGDQDAEQRFNVGVRTNLRTILFRPLRYFLYQYIRCGSILGGIEGFVYSLLFAELELNIQLKIWELQEGYSVKSCAALHAQTRKCLNDHKF